MVLDSLLSLCGVGQTNDDKKKQAKPKASSKSDPYNYPNLYEEADEMLSVALLIYTVTDLRTMAKQKKTKLKNPERILELPLTLEMALSVIEENFEEIKKMLGDSDHEMALNALEGIQERYERHSTTSQRWSNPWAENNIEPAYLTQYGDDNPDKELVYAVGVDPVRKRVTVVFRGSVTPADFVCDASISFNKRDNPLKAVEGQDSKIGLHHGFDEYLLKRRLAKSASKYDEIVAHVKELFKDEERYKTHKLYCSGHSLGGALATLFAMEVAAELANGDSSIPTPVTCVSVASPRVGDQSFQKAFRHLEESYMLRHLRIANAGDPVTIIPKSSSKKLFALMSPVSYLAFKLQDQDFAEKETYRHTGIRLLLREDDKDPVYELSYGGVTSAKEELEKEEADEGDSKAKSKKGSWSVFSSVKDVPNVTYHFGTAYAHRMVKVKEELSAMSLNELYETL